MFLQARVCPVLESVVQILVGLKAGVVALSGLKRMRRYGVLGHMGAKIT